MDQTDRILRVNRGVIINTPTPCRMSTRMLYCAAAHCMVCMNRAVLARRSCMSLIAACSALRVAFMVGV